MLFALFLFCQFVQTHIFKIWKTIFSSSIIYIIMSCYTKAGLPQVDCELEFHHSILYQGL